MKLKTLISRGECFGLPQKLEIPTNVNSLEGIEELEGLEELTFEFDFLHEKRWERIRDYSLLGSENLRQSLKDVSLNGSSVRDISFLEGYQRLNQLAIGTYCEGHCKNIKSFGVLDSDSLKASVKVLRLGLKKNKHLKDFSFLNGYKKLKTLEIGFASAEDYSALGSDSLKKTVKNLCLNQNEGLTSLSFLNGYQNLRILSVLDHLSGGWNAPRKESHSVTDFSGLNSDSLKDTLEILSLCYLGLEDLSFLEGYKNLTHIDIRACHEICDYSGLGADSLKGTLNELTISGAKCKGLSFLSGYQNLSAIDLTDSKDIIDYSALASDSLAETVEELTLRGNSGFMNLSLLRNYKKLVDLNLRGTSVGDISDLLNYESVKNKSFEAITLPSDRINWTKVVNGKYINIETVHELEKKGIIVKHIGAFPDYLPRSPRPEDLVRTLARQLSSGDEKLAEIISTKLTTSIENYFQSKSESPLLVDKPLGRISKKVVAVGDHIYKVTSSKYYHQEMKVYETYLGTFSEFVPNFITGVYNEEIGILVVENLDNKSSKFKQTTKIRDECEKLASKSLLNEENNIRRELERKSLGLITKRHDDKDVLLRDHVREEGAVDVYDYIDHFMYVVGLFHSSDFAALRLGQRNFDPNPVDYIKAVHEVPKREFHELINNANIPLSEKGVLSEARSYLEETSYTPIIGDFKKNNTVKGYVIDFDKVQMGNPLEDLIRFLEQSDFCLSNQAKKHFLKKYFIYRELHNPLSETQKKEILTNYPLLAYAENMRNLRGKCLWDQNLSDPYYTKKEITALENTKRAVEQLCS